MTAPFGATTLFTATSLAEPILPTVEGSTFVTLNPPFPPTLTEHIAPAEPPCTDCDGLPNVAPSLSPAMWLPAHPHATASTTATATSSSTGIAGAHSAAATSSSVAWDKSPVIGPLTAFLLIYTLASCAALGLLLFSGRLDFKCDLHLGRNDPWRQENDRLSRANYSDGGAFVPRTNQSRIEQQLRSRIRESILTHSVVETVIDYEEPQQSEARETFSRYDAMEMRPIPNATTTISDSGTHEWADGLTYDQALGVVRARLARFMANDLNGEELRQFREMMGETRYRLMLVARQGQGVGMVQSGVVRAGRN